MNNDMCRVISHHRVILGLYCICSCLGSFGQGQISRPTKKQAIKQQSVVKVSALDEYVNGHGYVDLGLPSGIKWSTTNWGSERPYELGQLYAWGELETKEKFSKENSSWQGKEVSDFAGNPEYDVACKLWDSNWRYPTLKEIQELVDNCSWKWTKLNGKRGFFVTDPNKKSIFLPARISTYEFLYGEYFCNY